MNKQALLFCGTLFCGMCCVGAQAATEFITPMNSNPGGGPVDASATFAISGDTIAVTLMNLGANPTDVGQNISDLSFTLGGGSLTNASLSSSSGEEITVAHGGGFTTGSSVSTGWGFTHTATSVDLDAIGFVGPKHTIIGPPGPGNLYSNANGSIAPNSAHNPFLNQTATFDITGTGITAGTTVDSATFSFGTMGQFTVPGTPVTVSVPEPGSFGLLVLGLAGVLIVARRRRRTDSAPA
jgi:hypothetical protein